MKMGIVTTVPKSRHDLYAHATEHNSICPHCWKIHDRATAVNTSRTVRPASGDFTCCYGCGNFSMFNDALDLVPIPDVLMQALPAEVFTCMTDARAIVRKDT